MFLRITIIFLVVYNNEALKILFIAPMPSRSHNILATRLYTELAAAGHKITYFSAFPQERPMKDVEYSCVNEILEHFSQNNDGSLCGLAQQTAWENAMMVMSYNLKFTEFVLKNDDMQKLLRSDKKFDIVLIYQYLNDGLLGVAHHFNAPVVYFSSMPLYAPESFTLAHPTSSSYAPNILTPYTGKMSFLQRFWNSLMDVSMISYYNWFILPKHADLVRKYVPGQLDLNNFVNNISFIFINSHPSVTPALPLAPNAIEVGGFHIVEPKQLPDDLQMFLDSSASGVVLFSMGSISTSTQLSQRKKDIFMKTFAKLKVNVLCKWEDTHLPNLPQNIKLMKWIPQGDVLAHPNVKAFLSHGGLLSTLESMFNEVPIVGIPLLVDQKMNMASAEENGYGINLSFQDLNEETLLWALEEILHNPKYKKAIQVHSRILKDRPGKPMESIHYWINYVARHHGAPHLNNPGTRLTWYQRHLLDVGLLIFLLIAVLTYSICFIFKQLKKSHSPSMDKKIQ